MPNDYVSLLVDFTKDYESPTSFWKWSAYSTVAACLRFNVFLKHKVGKVYPNTYTVLLADSARFRKGQPLEVAELLLSELHVTKTFTGTASIQGILDKLSQEVPNKHKGVTIKGGACLILASELASFFVDDPRLLPLLTNLYDYRKEFPYDLRSNSIIIKDVCVSMLAASNEVFLREVYTGRAVYGGLLRRTILVKPDAAREPNSLVDPTKSVDELLAASQKKELLTILDCISKMTGPMVIEDNAAKLYSDWYNELYRNYDKYGSRTGVVEGIHTLILKIAIAKTAARGSMTIDLQTITDAILEVTALKPNYEVYAMQAGGSNLAQKATIVMNNLWEAKDYKLRKQDILMKHWNDLTSEEFDQIMETFIQGGLVQATFLGSDAAYELTVAAIDKLNAKMNKP